MNVTFENVTVVRGGRAVISDLSARATAGKVLGIIGPNGSGKTSLLRACFRALQLDSGRILLDDQDVATMRRRDIARRIAVMGQERPDEFGLTVWDSVLLGRTPRHTGFGHDTPEDIDRAREAMSLVGILDLADRPVSALSGGERQRALLARAITQEPDVLLLDEPTNHLDVAYRFQLMEQVNQLPFTTIVTLHELELALAYCDHVLVLDQGRLVAEGPPPTALTPALIRQVFGVEATPVLHPATGQGRVLLDGAAITAERAS